MLSSFPHEQGMLYFYTFRFLLENNTFQNLVKIKAQTDELTILCILKQNATYFLFADKIPTHIVKWT